MNDCRLKKDLARKAFTNGSVVKMYPITSLETPRKTPKKHATITIREDKSLNGQCTATHVQIRMAKMKGKG